MDEHEAGADRRRYLTIYLRDHRTGAEAGVRLAQRCRDHAPNPSTAASLEQIAKEIDADRQALTTIMAGLDIDPSSVKHIAGLIAERVGRLKLNGRAVRTSPLSVLVELEGLIGAVSIKRELWTTLQTLATDTLSSDAELKALIARADDQRAELQAVHGRIASDLFLATDRSHHRLPTGSGSAISSDAADDD